MRSALIQGTRATLVLAPLLGLLPMSAARSQTPSAAPATAQEQASESYSIGLVFGNQLHSAGLENTLSLDDVVRGLKEGLAGRTMTAQDKERSIQMVRAGREALATRNRAVAKEFLSKNAAVAGVVTTKSGLQYTILAAGDSAAASPTLTDRVTVKYRGQLLDGTEFDKSDAHSQPATFALSGVIKGWREALMLMKPGGRWRLYVPPELAYDSASPPPIPPGSLLIFEIELQKVEPAPVMQGPPSAERKGAVDPH